MARSTCTSPRSSPRLTNFTLHIADRVEVVQHQSGPVDGSLTLPAESWLRLVAGRLTPEHTPAVLQTTGAADLALLRRDFPGY